MQRIIVSRGWCDHHLAYCFQSYNEQTGEHKHLGNPDSIEPAGTQELAQEIERLQEIGYYSRHHGGVYYFTRRMSQSLTNPQPEEIPLPFEWEMRIEAEEIQDW